jgi:ribonuclease P protein component
MTDQMPTARAGGDTPAARAGFVVGRLVGPAVTRNRVKRRLRHLMRERIGALPPGSRVVIRALPAAARADFAELARDLDTALAAARPTRPAHQPRSTDGH